jgi:hypothetical protein
MSVKSSFAENSTQPSHWLANPLCCKLDDSQSQQIEGGDECTKLAAGAAAASNFEKSNIYTGHHHHHHHHHHHQNKNQKENSFHNLPSEAGHKNCPEKKVLQKSKEFGC